MTLSFISYAHAESTGAAPADPNALFNLLPLILIFLVFYILIIRPQSKKLREHEKVINALKRGDEVITGGGILGKIVKIDEGSNIVSVEISDGVVVRANRATIIDVVKNDKQTNNKTQNTKKKQSKSQG